MMGDGAVIFVTDQIDAGNPSTPTIYVQNNGKSLAGANGAGIPYPTPGSKSPYGVWGALGTRASKEVIQEWN
jgi:hypothetical protein